VTGLAVFLTGAGALTIEVLLVRALTPVLGAAPRTLGAVAAAFLFALALGSLAARPLLRRARRPALAFALLSLGAGAAGALSIALSPALIALLPPAGAAGSVDPFAFAAAFAASLPPAFLMGTAFPFAVAASQSGRRGAGRLYGLNTLGGVAGALLTPTFFLPALGVSGSSLAALLLEASGGFLLLLLAAARRPAGAASREGPETVPAEGEAPRPQGGSLVPAAILVAASSALALAAEVALARLLALFLRNSVYTVAIVLGGFLLGNGWGALSLSGAAARSGRPVRLAGLLLSLAGLAAAAGLHAVFLLARAADAGARVSGPGFLGLDGLLSEVAFEFSLAAPVVFLPAFFFGAAFPAVLAIAPGPRPAAPLAALVAASGLGSVAGALGATIGLVPSAGASRAVLAAGGGAAVLGAALLFFRARSRGVALLLALAFAALAAPVATPLRVFRGGEDVTLVAYEEGPAAAVAVVRDAGGGRKLKVNGTYSQGGGEGVVLERRQGMIAALLASGTPRRVLLVGVGTGHTLAGVLAIPGVESVEAVEILPEIANVLSLFSETNRRAHEDPRVTLRVDDGRRIVRERDGAGLDLVVCDLVFPWEAGAGSLFAREQFEAVRRALGPDGTFVQWLPLHQLGGDVLKSVVATFLAVFPDAALFLGAPNARLPIAALVARAGGETRFSLADLGRAWAVGPVAADLAAHGLLDEFDALALYVNSGEGLRPLAAGAPVNTDDSPFVELEAPAFAARTESLGAENLGAILSLRSAAGPPLSGAHGEGELRAMRARQEATTRLIEGFRQEILAALDPRTRVVPDYAAMYLRREEAAHLAAFEADPAGGLVRVVATERVLSRLRARQFGEALSLLDRMAGVEPEEAAWRSLAAAAHLGLGEAAEAEAAVRAAIARRPGHAPDHALLGRALEALGRPDEARAAFEEALRLDPANAAAKKGLEDVPPR